MKGLSKNPGTWGAVFLSGLVLGFSQPFFTPGFSLIDHNWLGALGFVGYVPLLLLLRKSSLKQTFLYSFLAVSIQYCVIVYWIYIAVHTYGHVAPLPSMLITFALAALMATKAGIFFTIGRYLSDYLNTSFIWLSPIVICALEYFKNFYVFGGFCWGNVGYSIGRIDEILQVASLVGVYGLVFLAALVNAFLAEAYLSRKGIFLFFALLIVGSSFTYGALRIKNGKNEFAKSIEVAMLQGNIPQEMKSSSRLYADDILEIYLKMQREAKANGAKLVIWPESAWPRMLSENITELGLSDEEQVASIIGVTVYGGDKSFHAHNSALLVNNDGRVVRRYDKTHLVPFGEYVPWPFSKVVDKIVPGMGAFLPGTNFIPEKLSLGLSDQLMVGTTICYEGIFPEISRSYARNGASLLVNLTNDAWYGESSAPFQHLLMYRMRSVESGLPFVRATNSGVSAWIDPYGRVHDATKLFERTMEIVHLPLIKKNTVYLLIGDFVGALCLIFLLLEFIYAVISLRGLFDRKEWKKLLLVGFMGLLVLGFGIYYSTTEFLTDESARTKILLIFCYALLFLVGFLSKSAHTRSILLIFGSILLLFSAALTILEAPVFLLGVFLGLLLYLLALRIKLKPTKID